ncbi:hypothetical protein FRC04_007100 [Tulasnella sp. 424]|nr:hypothetical protein FRC04_007100 [Tulasnella sp. 424]
MILVKRFRGKDVELPPPASSSSPTPNTNQNTTTFTDEAIGTGVRVHGLRFEKRKDEQSLPPTSNEKDESNPDDEEVNEIVVDNTFFLDGGTRGVTQSSDHGGTPEKSGTNRTHGTHGTDHDSVHSHREMMVFATFLNALRFRVSSSLNRFFFTEFIDAAAERQYKKETYYQMKGLSLAGSLVLVLNWRLNDVVPSTYQICPCFVIPLPAMIVFDWPKAHPRIYQLFMSFMVWSWCPYALLLLQLCGYYNKADYAVAYPVIALFALGQNRLMGAFMAVLNAVLIGSVIRLKRTWSREFLNYLLYTVFLLWIHYKHEAAERRLYAMRDRLKVQYRATQKAQVRESRAADSKKWLSSYIFNEVRVLLNTARESYRKAAVDGRERADNVPQTVLAAHYMQATGFFAPDDIEYTALEGSLNRMSKVLNDVLDFNRMDSGRFESVSKPYAFHKVVKGMLVPLRLTAQARGQELVTELDSQIDIMARTALYRAKGMTKERIAQLFQDGDDEDAGLIVGDEHRLRQVLTNLASNACKFTPHGGKITVRTKLLLPGFGAVEDGTTAVGDSSPTLVKLRTEEDDDDYPPLGNDDDDFENREPRVSQDIEAPPLTGERLTALKSCARPCQDQIVIRIEVEDTGVGIRRQDMIDNKLFSPYVRTDFGRFHGGMTTGLGLALSKDIVRLSGGRLGVKSKHGQGSMFWVELAVGVGQKVIASTAGPSQVVGTTSETPKIAPGSSPFAAAQPPPPLPFNPPLNVLVVDDDALTRKLMTRILTRNGCVVQTADNGKSAFDMAINAKTPFNWDSASTTTDAKSNGGVVHTPYLQEMEPKYDVIFLDNQMPVMRGVDTVRRLRAMKRKDFVVGVTGKALKEDQEEYFEAGVDAVLTKPVTEADLRRCLFSADERRKQAAAERQRRTSDAPPVSVLGPSPSGPS